VFSRGKEGRRREGGWRRGRRRWRRRVTRVTVDGLMKPSR